MPDSPLSRSLKYLREKGYVAEKVEKWNAYAKIRQDFGGFADIIAFNETETIAIQATTTPNILARESKIMELPKLQRWLLSPYRRVEIHGWAKRGERGKRKTWTLKVREIKGGNDEKCK